MDQKLAPLFCALALLAVTGSALADNGPVLTTKLSNNDTNSTQASGQEDRSHVLGAVGLGGVAETNNVQGNSAGVVAQIRLRSNGRFNDQGLYDTRVNGTYNVISDGDSGVSTTLGLRGEAMLAGAVQSIKNTCTMYAGGSAYGRTAIASANNGAANSARFMIGPETGLACDVGGVLLEVSPTVGFGAAANASQSLTTGPVSGGSAIMAGGVARVTVVDRVHFSARGAATVPKADISGGPSANMTMVGADVDFRVADGWNIGVTADGMHYANDPSMSGMTRNEGQITTAVTATF